MAKKSSKNNKTIIICIKSQLEIILHKYGKMNYVQLKKSIKIYNFVVVFD